MLNNEHPRPMEYRQCVAGPMFPHNPAGQTLSTFAISASHPGFVNRYHRARTSPTREDKHGAERHTVAGGGHSAAKEGGESAAVAAAEGESEFHVAFLPKGWRAGTAAVGRTTRRFQTHGPRRGHRLAKARR